MKKTPEAAVWFAIWTWFGGGADTDWKQWAHPTYPSTYLRPFTEEADARKFARRLNRKGVDVTVTQN